MSNRSPNYRDPTAESNKHRLHIVPIEGLSTHDKPKMPNKGKLNLDLITTVNYHCIPFYTQMYHNKSDFNAP